MVINIAKLKQTHFWVIPKVDDYPKMKQKNPYQQIARHV